MTLLKKLGNYLISKNFLLNFLAIIAVYFIGYFTLTKCLNSSTNHGEEIEVPNLIGKNQNNLKNIFTNLDLNYVVLDSIYDPSKVEGTIISQDPEPTSISTVYVKEGRKIKLSVSKRTQLVEMPDLIDKSQRFAESILRNRKFRFTLDYKPSKEAHGAVMQQLYKNKPIEGGTKIPIGSRVKLVVGRDEAGVPQPLPNLYGLTIAEARQRVAGMLNMEFLVSCEAGYTREDSLSARVITQSPEYVDENSRVASGTTIQVFATKDFSGDVPE